MKFKKGDIILAVLVILAVAAWFGRDIFWPDAASKTAVIELDGEVYTTVPLGEERELQRIDVDLPDGNYVKVVASGEYIWVEEASCPDQICVKTGKISKPGQSIVCLPNKTIIHVEGTDDTDDDEFKVDDSAY